MGLSVPPRPASNPIAHGLEGRPFQMADAPLWLLDTYADISPRPIQTICGRCQSLPPAWDLEFTWGSNKPTKTTLPGTVPNLRSDWCYIFDSIRLTRRKLIQPGLLQPADWIRLVTAPLTNACCNYASQFLGSTREVVPPPKPAPSPSQPPTTSPPYVDINAIPNLQWFLFYTNSSNSIGGAVPIVPAAFDTSLLITDPIDSTDSTVTPADTSDFPALPPDCSGWVLALVKRYVFISTPDAPLSPEDAALVQGLGVPSPDDPTATIYVVFNPYAMYQLLPPSSFVTGPPDPDTGIAPIYQPSAVFNCKAANTWQLQHNPLNLPQHTIRTLPAGP